MGRIHYIADALKETDLMAKVLAGDQVRVDKEVPAEYSLLEERSRPFYSAVDDVFRVTLRLPVTHETSFLVAKNCPLMGAVSATIELTGDFNALVAVSFDSRLARLLTARIARCAPETLAKSDLLDGVGEIVNQVSGRARTSFHRAGLAIEIDLPTLIREPSVPFPLDSGAPCHILIYRCLNRRFAVQLSQPATILDTASG